MKLQSQRRIWDSLAKFDPMWAVLAADGKKGGKWNLGEFFKTGVSEVQSVMADLKVLGVPLNTDTVLDFGCGIGRATQAFTEFFEHCVGIDISREMISEAKKLNRFPDRCAYAINDNPDLHQFVDNTFDLVYSNLVLQHIPSGISARYIKEFARVAKPAGVVVFQIPSHIHWRRRIQWRRRLFVILQSMGFSGNAILQKLKLNPMRMAFIPRQRVERLLESCSTSVIDVKSWSDDEIASCRYVAVKNRV